MRSWYISYVLNAPEWDTVFGWYSYTSATPPTIGAIKFHVVTTLHPDVAGKSPTVNVTGITEFVGPNAAADLKRFLEE